MNCDVDICPKCNKPNNCAIANKRSVSNCWCMKKPIKTFKEYEGMSCLCEECYDESKIDYFYNRHIRG